MKKLVTLSALAVLALAVPAHAQWQVQDHSIPVGRGGQGPGFRFAAPGTAGQALLSTGPSTDPAFGAISGAFGTQTANTIYAGPTSGGAALPAFRALVGADIPFPSASTLGGVQSLTCSASNWFRTLSTGGVFGCSQPNFTDLAGSISIGQVPNSLITNAKLANMAANSYKGNPTTGSAAPTDFTASSLTLKAAPVSGDIVIIEDSAASFGMKKTTVGALASAGSVGSVNGKTGAVVWSVNKQQFINSGTYTPTPGMVYAIIECRGSGGGGGGAAAAPGSPAVQINVGGGGGSGGYSRSVVSAANVGASQTVTVNNAGTGGAAGNNNGTAGGNVSVGTLCVANGGGAGQYSQGNVQNGQGGLGGALGTGDYQEAGYPGGAGGTGGSGGASVTASLVAGWGGGPGGGRAMTNPANGEAASGYGSGGSGGSDVASNTARAGGNGSKGVVFVTEYLVN